MKITLIYPCSDIHACGIRSLSSCLKKENFEVQLIFLPIHFNNEYKKETLNKVVDISKNSCLIGISVMTNYFYSSIQITQWLKKNLNVPVLWGGVHPTIRPEESLNYSDMVCIGEGENSLIELTDRIKEGKDFHNVFGIWLNNREGVIKNPIRPLIQDLDSLPFPDYDFKTHYLISDNQSTTMDEYLIKRHTSGVYLTMPSRGCPFLCSYCWNNAFNKMYPNQKLVRKRSIDNIINELVQVRNKIPTFKKIMFNDDAFLSRDIAEMKEFCEKYKQNIGLPLIIVGAPPPSISREKLTLLVNAGAIVLEMGIQTASERTKKLYRRHHSNQQVESAAKIMNEFKNRLEIIQYDIILDNPFESDEDLIETLKFLAKLPPPFTLAIFSLTFYPGTELYDVAKSKGMIPDEHKMIYRKEFHTCKKTYLNRLFFLLKEYTAGGGKISPKMMNVLTHKKIIKLKINWLIYFILKIGAVPYRLRYFKFGYLFKEAIKDVLKGDLLRIKTHIKRHFKLLK
ncbi:MAG: radical SAM protein [bacterium]